MGTWHRIRCIMHRSITFCSREGAYISAHKAAVDGIQVTKSRMCVAAAPVIASLFGGSFQSFWGPSACEPHEDPFGSSVFLQLGIGMWIRVYAPVASFPVSLYDHPKRTIIPTAFCGRFLDPLSPVPCLTSELELAMDTGE